MDLVTNSEICLFCNSLKYKDNLRYRLEAGDPRRDIFNILRPPALHTATATDTVTDTVTANGHGRTPGRRAG